MKCRAIHVSFLHKPLLDDVCRGSGIRMSCIIPNSVQGTLCGCAPHQEQLQSQWIRCLLAARAMQLICGCVWDPFMVLCLCGAAVGYGMTVRAGINCDLANWCRHCCQEAPSQLLRAKVLLQGVSATSIYPCQGFAIEGLHAVHAVGLKFACMQ